MKHRNTFMLMIAIILLTIAYTPWADANEVGVSIIVNPSMDISSLTQSDIEKIFLGKKKIWEKSNQEIFFVTMKTQNQTHINFLLHFLNMTPEQFIRHWRKKIFTGEARSIKVFGTEKDIIDYIFQTNGAIGYVSSKTFSDKVKFISIEGR